MKVEIIRSETIKPSTPTPQHHKTLKLSLLDQILPIVYTSVVLFYPNNNNNNNVFTSNQISQILKKSLCKTLASFYPFAGKINVKDSVVECNDDGARFVEAESDGLLSAVLENRFSDDAMMQLFLPADFYSPEAGVSPLQVQATFFSGGDGGLALGVCVLHKLADAATLALFLKTWAATAAASRNGSGNEVLAAGPDFESGPAEFPARDLSLLGLLQEGLARHDKAAEWATRRYVFDKSKIAALKAKTGGALLGGGLTAEARPPSRVEAVTALMWKCAAAAAAKPRSVVVQIVNIRARVEPPFPSNSVGNLVGYFAAAADRDAELRRSGALGDLAVKLRRGIEEFVENIAKKLRGDRSSKEEVLWMWLKNTREIYLRGSDVDVFVCSSWCRFGFYEIEFGFGKPLYVGVQGGTKENMIVLMDTRDGDGVEVCLSLTKQNMACFDSDSDLLDLTSSGF